MGDPGSEVSSGLATAWCGVRGVLGRAWGPGGRGPLSNNGRPARLGDLCSARRGFRGRLPLGGACSLLLGEMGCGGAPAVHGRELGLAEAGALLGLLESFRFSVPFGKIFYKCGVV